MRIMIGSCARCRQPIFEDESHSEMLGRPTRGLHDICPVAQSNERTIDFLKPVLETMSFL
jgi:hypothetical protein